MHWHQAPTVAVGLRPAAGGEGTPAPVAESEVSGRNPARRGWRDALAPGAGDSYRAPARRWW